jgi:hypothetical protein
MLEHVEYDFVACIYVHGGYDLYLFSLISSEKVAR